jgi:hypothetical protein
LAKIIPAEAGTAVNKQGGKSRELALRLQITRNSHAISKIKIADILRKLFD